MRKVVGRFLADYLSIFGTLEKAFIPAEATVEFRAEEMRLRTRQINFGYLAQLICDPGGGGFRGTDYDESRKRRADHETPFIIWPSLPSEPSCSFEPWFRPRLHPASDRQET